MEKLSNNKEKTFTKSQIDLAEMVHAMGHKTRIKILLLLYEHKRLRLNEINEFLGYSKCTIFQHLVILVKSGLICASKEEGKFTQYTLSKAHIEKVKEFCDSILEKYRQMSAI